jgi:TMEM175 potassium channel family protein
VESRRAEAFSDGVFAVAITVLVFNLLPIGKDVALHAGTLLGSHAWPNYAAYGVSFLTIGIMWMNHHAMFSRISRVDTTLLALNLFLLMGVVAIPFPTALVAEHLIGPSAVHGQAETAVTTYGLVMIAISIGFGSIWIYIAGHQSKLRARQVRPPRLATLRFTGGNVGYLGGTITALFAPVPALIIFGLLAVYYLTVPQPDPDAADAPGGASAQGSPDPPDES